MRRSARIWSAALLVASLVAAQPVATAAPSPQTRPTSTPRSNEQSASTAALEQLKLKEEIRALHRANTQRWWQSQVGLGVVGALVAIGGLLWTVIQQRREFVRQRTADRKTAERDQETRLDGLFAQLARDVASQDLAVRLSALAAIESFTGPERSAYHRQLLGLLQGILKVHRSDVSDRALARAFLAFLAAQQQAGSAVTAPLDLEAACLDGSSIAALDLRAADLRAAGLKGAFIAADVDMSGIDGRGLSGRRLRSVNGRFRGARLENADLQETSFRDADLREAKLRHANLISADFRRSCLIDARLTHASLQSAHLDGADLRGARFDRADLRDTYFLGAIFDEPCLESIRRSSFWRQAHFDPEVRARLDAD